MENQREGMIKLVNENEILSIIIVKLGRQLKGRHCKNGLKNNKKTHILQMLSQETHSHYRDIYGDKCMDGKNNT